MSVNMEQIEHEVHAWAVKNFPNAQPYQPLLGALEELGELSHAHLKMEQGIRGSFRDHQLKKIDAVGDIVIYLIHYCLLNGIAFSTTLENTWNYVKERNWVVNKENGVMT